MKDLQIWKFIQTQLLKDQNTILFTVVNHKKGSPGKTGFKMAVSTNVEFIGSIGGGVMEFNLMNSCKKLFQSGKEINTAERYFHYKRKLLRGQTLPGKESGLICSGSQIISTNLLTKINLTDIKKIRSAYQTGESIILKLDQNGLSLGPAEKSDRLRYRFKSFEKKKWLYEENLELTDTILIAGCGHVGYALCKLMSDLNFRTIIYDDRKDQIFNFKRISGSRIVKDSFSNIQSHLKNFNINYAVIVTSGFESDKEVLKNLISLDLKYLGLMGTKAKISKIFSDLIKVGIPKEHLKKIKAPVGLDINSNTPEEIAVSIAAEIIKIRNCSLI